MRNHKSSSGYASLFLFAVCFTATSAPAQSVDLIAQSLEVTQGIQSGANSVRLVANQRTFVRFYVTASGGDARTTALLRATAGANSTTLSPSNSGGEIAVPAEVDRSNIQTAFLFELPDGYTAGSVT